MNSPNATYACGSGFSPTWMHRGRLKSALLGLLTLALCAGCQSTFIRSAWFDTTFAGPPMRKIVVVGDVGSTASSRLVEDAFVEKLRAAGVDAVAGHTVKIDFDTGDTPFMTAVGDTGAQGLLLVRLLGVDTRTQVTTTMAPGGMAWGRGPWGTSTWQTVPVTQVSQHDLATVETKLFDVKSRGVVWAATTETFNPRSVAQEVPSFATIIVRALADRGIVAGK